MPNPYCDESIDVSQKLTKSVEQRLESLKSAVSAGSPDVLNPGKDRNRIKHSEQPY
jgi:hypothetical protein